MIESLNNFDWEEAFKYASNPSAIFFSDTKVNTTGYDREDVEEVLGLSEGENDGDGWVGAFKLKDGRFAMLEAWCDYTGWG